ncbi:hypothetical protein [Ferruginibacter sp. SUN106]|uniref:hypothetical protein n=1 Tax=Ferruginibacter sp. SUN106 TaxID=2978348 RepID=UPI003D35DF8F
MSRLTILITSAIALATFLAGWLLHGIVHPGKTNYNELVNPADTIHNREVRKTKIPDDFNNTNITGRFILSQSNCAGFNFINNTTILWTNEIACDDPDTLKIRWLDNKTFMTKSTLRVNQSCPPKIDIYKVVSYDGKQLSLKAVATGWNDPDDVTLDFTKQSN